MPPLHTKKLMQLLETKKSHATSREEEKNNATTWDQKNHATSSEKNHAISQNKTKNHATP